MEGICETTGFNCGPLEQEPIVRLGIKYPSVQTIYMYALAFRIYHGMKNDYLAKVLVARNLNDYGEVTIILQRLAKFHWSEIRDAMAYFRLAVSQDDDLAFERIVNTPKRGLGDKALEKMHRHARARLASPLPTSGVGIRVSHARASTGARHSWFMSTAGILSSLLLNIASTF